MTKSVDTGKRIGPGLKVKVILIIAVIAILVINWTNDPDGFESGLPYFVGLVLVITIFYRWVKKQTFKQHAPFRKGLRNPNPGIREKTLHEILDYLRKNIDQFGDLTPHIVDAMQDTHPSVRLAAAEIITTFIDEIRVGVKGSVHQVFPCDMYPDIERGLSALGNDDHEPVRRMAVSALEKMAQLRTR